MSLMTKSFTILGAGVLAVFLWGVTTAYAEEMPKSPALPAQGDAAVPQTLQQWIERLHQASRRRAYAGTFVVSDGDQMAVSKIWHVCDGTQQVERIETLTGAHRVTLRRNDEVTIIAPDRHVIRKEKHEAMHAYPGFQPMPGVQLENQYAAKPQGIERVAGFDALVVDFLPKDGLRYAYRIWSEKKTGLVVKMQTRDAGGHVVEQVAFTDLQLDAPVRAEALMKPMEGARDYAVLRPVLRKTALETEGWRLKASVPGFQPVSCYARSEAESKKPAVLQCVFSDGLASVSLFLETYEPQRHTKEGSGSAGATHSLARRYGEHWVTALGEVPVETLNRFVSALERTR